MTDTASASAPATTKADWTSDQEPRWCPGCGDYSVLTAMQLMLPELDAVSYTHLTLPTILLV